jgi:hypothetical protein
MSVDTGAWHQRLTGRFSVPLPPMQAFRLFTPLGERDWAPGWEPSFPAETLDDSEPGTAFLTHAHGRVRTWLVVEREVGRRIRYSNVAPGDRASLITVELAPAATGSEVTVTYDVTALGDAGARELLHFAEGYPRYLASWQEQILACLAHNL